MRSTLAGWGGSRVTRRNGLRQGRRGAQVESASIARQTSGLSGLPTEQMSGEPLPWSLCRQRRKTPADTRDSRLRMNEMATPNRTRYTSG